MDLASTDHVKLRLGALNGVGQQKGVDSLIVTDLIELARNNAIQDAVLLAGDEDLRVGVQIAQSFGVAVHLVGIVPSRGSQSIALRQEADTTTELDAIAIGRFLTVKAPLVVAAAPTSGVAQPLDATNFVNSLESTALQAVQNFWREGGKGLPRDIDGTMLQHFAGAMGAKLTQEQTRTVRADVVEKIKKRLNL